jgi:hypothetical protein
VTDVAVNFTEMVLMRIPVLEIGVFGNNERFRVAFQTVCAGHFGKRFGLGDMAAQAVEPFGLMAVGKRCGGGGSGCKECSGKKCGAGKCSVHGVSPSLRFVFLL